MAAIWSDWTPDVAPDVPGCPSFTLERAVKQTVMDFLERTHWVQRSVAPIDVTGGASARTFTTPVVAAGERVLAVLKAWLDGTEIPVYGPADLEDDQPDWKTVTGDPTSLVMERDGEYYIVPSPTSTMTAALRLKVAIGLLDAATSCEDSILQNWRDAIAFGAKARLMLMPNERWTALDLGASYQNRYMDQVKGACVRAIRTPARRPLVVKPYYF